MADTFNQKPIHPKDEVQEADEESFPASDPPAYTGSTVGRKKEKKEQEKKEDEK